MPVQMDEKGKKKERENKSKSNSIRISIAHGVCVTKES